MLYGNEKSLTDYIRGVSSVTVKSVRDVAEKYLDFDRSVFVLLSPMVN
jgi:predicted Zn-dependent peptidase